MQIATEVQKLMHKSHSNISAMSPKPSSSHLSLVAFRIPVFVRVSIIKDAKSAIIII